MEIAAARRLVQAYDRQNMLPNREPTPHRPLVVGRRRIHWRIAARGLVAVATGRLIDGNHAADAVRGIDPANLSPVQVSHKAVIEIHAEQ